MTVALSVLPQGLAAFLQMRGRPEKLPALLPSPIDASFRRKLLLFHPDTMKFYQSKWRIDVRCAAIRRPEACCPEGYPFAAENRLPHEGKPADDRTGSPRGLAKIRALR